MDQYVILVNQEDEILGVEEKLVAHQEGLLHRAFSLIIFNENREMLLQRRAMGKYHSAGLWTNTCCSHPILSEDIEQTIHKRLQFEMGFDTKLEFAFSFSYKSNFTNGLIEHELDYVYYGFYDGSPQINPNEVMDFKWASIEILRDELKNNPQTFTSWFPYILDKM